MKQPSRQLSFDYPLARSSDPSTSHISEHRLRRTGEHTRQKGWVLGLVLTYPGSTARQLAESTPNFAVNHPIIWRRLPDLEKEGMVVKGPVNYRRRPAVTWFPTDKARAMAFKPFAA